MITQKQLKELVTKELIHCDGCGGFHPMDECEIVIVRMIKGKNCELKSLINESVTKRIEIPVTTETVSVVKDNLPVKQIVNIPPEGYHIPPAEMEAINKNKKSIIPPGLAAMMIDPSDPNFETKGAKEIRKT